MHECFVWFSLTSERFIEVFVPCQKSKQSGHVYVIGVSSVPLTCSSIGFWTVPCIMPEKWAVWSYIYVIGLSSLPLTIIFFIGFWTVPCAKLQSLIRRELFKPATFHWYVEQELLTLPEHLSSPPVFSGVSVTWSLGLYVCFVDRCLSFCPFSFGHCVVCPSIYGFWLPLWYLQTLQYLTRKVSGLVMYICNRFFEPVSY